ncbi:MAG: PBP1A family penicillin-binding protein [bacterium]|nr:PBP1A family penicillin-binding protein [bacterium]
MRKILDARALLSVDVPRRWVRRVLWLALGLFLVTVGGTIAGLNWLASDLPPIDALRTIDPSVKTVIYAANGDVLREFFAENRTIVPLDRIPQVLQQAVIAVEDKRFRSHYGIDLKRVIGVVWINLTSNSSQGGSTLTQQLARNLFPKLLPSEKRVMRKFREWIVAAQIESLYTKDEILAMYLNQIYLGRGAYGVQAAARIFFGRDVWNLGPAECTMLAGMIQQPERFSPHRNPAAAYARRAIVLGTMVGAGYLTRGEADAIDETKVRLADPDAVAQSAGFAAYFVEEVRKWLEKEYGATRLYRDGLRVHTTLVPQFQEWMEDALETHLLAEEKNRTKRQTRAHYDQLVAEGKRPPKVTYLQGAALLQDVRTGAVLGLVGGRSFEDSKWNMAMQAKRQPGSTFKPFVYLTALQHGYTPSSILIDTPFELDTGVSGIWRPQNYSETFGGAMTVRWALSHSVNVPTAKLYVDLGLDPVLENLRKLGFAVDTLPKVPSLYLGAGEVTLAEVVASYCAFANHGVWADQYLISRVETVDGEVLFESRVNQHEAIDANEAYVMTSLLQSTLDSGTAAGARRNGFTRTGAGKTGTTNDNTNAWFVGYTPSFCAGVWVGFDEPTPMGRGATGSRMAVPVWAAFMGRVTARKGDEQFTIPPGIVDRMVCLRTGQLARSGCDSIRSEVFLPGHHPQKGCPDHGGRVLDGVVDERDFRTLDRAEDEFTPGN